MADVTPSPDATRKPRSRDGDRCQSLRDDRDSGQSPSRDRSSGQSLRRDRSSGQPRKRIRDSGQSLGGDRDRGQLLLVGALALAVLFVALALLLNTAIYTGNLATRDAGVDATPVIEYVSESRAAGVEAVRSVNDRNNSDPTELNAAFRSAIDRWDDLASHHRAVGGDVVAVEVATVTNGTRIQQDDASRDFTSDAGDRNWTVAADADLSGVRSMRLTVDESTLADDPSDLVADDVFHVNVSSDAGTTSLFVYDDGGNPAVRVVDDGTARPACFAGSVTDGTFVIDVPNESVGGAACPALSNVSAVGDDVEISYRDSQMAGGTYTMVLDERPGELSALGVDAVDGGSPYWTHAIYGAQFDVTYRTEELDYEARIEVLPE
ncbi:DUF7261 family protein [Halobellus captivus]|uniref:DUF7261 family protein n=1 Tax=Halobellus captivus TaxID=2592614 RepID=UPI0011A5A074|nr:hypothetical protein [Halobellus captivus]